MTPTLLRRAVPALALLFLPHLAWSATRPAANLLLNPGFERGLEGHEWMPSNWDTSQSGLNTVFFGRDTLLKRSGRYGISIANTSTVLRMGHNWSQTILVGPEAWNKTATFSVWTYSAGQDGRAYVLLQAYRDTVTRLSLVWNVSREEVLGRLGIAPIDDPLLDLGWKDKQFEGGTPGWVRREVKIWVPEYTNVLFVRVGLFGTGQVAFDDASLVLGPPEPVAKVAPGQNVLVDPGFEDGGLEWEWVAPPFEGLRAELDSTVTHSGRYSIAFSHLRSTPVTARLGMAQPVDGRLIAGKQVKLTAWFKGDSLSQDVFTSVNYNTPFGGDQNPGISNLHGTFDWKQAMVIVNVPETVRQGWAWLQFTAPTTGRLWMDDASLTILGPVPRR
jgi:hypothetical protein